MNTLDILFVLPLLIIFSYLFDAFARRTKFPSVILLMLTGIIIRFFISFTNYDNFSFLDNLIPVLGTIGLILIVLEGAIELEITVEKLPLIFKGFSSALIILLANIFALQFLFKNIFSMEEYSSVLFAIPLAIISSAVAIPSASSLIKRDQEFVIYESTFSDILGIMIFNYCLLQAENGKSFLGVESLISLGLQILGVILISIFITYILFRLIQQIENKVKFFLILALLILVYAFGKLMHLPALVTIFIFGIFISNVKTLLPSFLKRNLDLEEKEKELKEFHTLTAESTFLVRTFFFLFFGFSIQILDFLSITTLVYGIIIFFVMFLIRYLYFLATSLKLKPSSLVYMSPRGLISILLFIQLKDVSFFEMEENPINEQILLIVILSSMLVMLLGTLNKKGKSEEESELFEEEAPFSLETDHNYPSFSKENDENQLIE